MAVKLSPEIVKKMRQLEIGTRRLFNSAMVGDSRSAQKGFGLEFDQIREYQMGDDIRFIDWSGSARCNKLLVKQYIEERNRTIIIAVDVSASSRYSSQAQARSDVMAQLAALLALVADYGKDRVGLILFSDRVEKIIPPNKGRQHVHAIMAALYTHKPRSAHTSLSIAFYEATAMKVKDGLLCVISDFIDHHNYESALKRASKKYEIISLRCVDQYEYALPAVGFLSVVDPETGLECMLDLRSKQSKSLTALLQQRLDEQKKRDAKYGVDSLDIPINKPFMNDVIRFFRQRMMY